MKEVSKVLNDQETDKKQLTGREPVSCTPDNIKASREEDWENLDWLQKNRMEPQKFEDIVPTRSWYDNDRGASKPDAQSQ